MLKAEEQMELVVLKKHGDSIRELSRVTGRSRNTVRRYLRGGAAAATRKAAPKRPEKLDPFKSYIVERMKAAAPDRIPATVLLREIKERGYGGGYGSLKVFVRGLIPAAPSEPLVRFETEPGRQMQADWASVGRGVHRHARLEPGGLCRILRQRTGRDADRLSRERVHGVRRRDRGIALRQHENGRA
jgi:transposase